MQDNYYFKKEANDFFIRWASTVDLENQPDIREQKLEIFNKIQKITTVENKRILEIGCFYGDLLAFMKLKFNCDVVGVEAGSLACEYAKKRYNLSLENNPFFLSSLFRLEADTFHQFDGIILDDVMSWMSRDIILPTIGVLDWLLKDGGFLFLRDYCPSFSFRYPNHHCKSEKVYSFKQSRGHKDFFLTSGKYLEVSSEIYNTTEFQLVETVKPDSTIWQDTVLLKLAEPLHPLLEL